MRGLGVSSLNAIVSVLIRQVLRLYPAAWRERYLEEMLLVLERHPVTLWTAADLLLGALDARLHADFLPGRVVSMFQRLRASVIALFCAIVLFGLAWAVMQEVKDPLDVWEATTRQYPALLPIFEVAQATGLIVLLALLVGGAPLVVDALRDALRSRRRGVVLLFLTPIFAVGGLVAFAALTLGASTARAAPGGADAPLTPLAVVLQLVLLVLLAGVIVGSVVAVSLAIVRAQVEARLLRFALLPAGVALVAMVAGAGATLALTVLSYQEAPQLAPGELAGCVVVMVGALGLAGVALGRGVRAARQPGE